MTAFQRLSTVPTIPELLRRDRERWLAHAFQRVSRRLPEAGVGRPLRSALLPAWTRRTRMAACFAGAEGILAVARVLNGCGLLSPKGIGAFLTGAERLTGAGMGIWHAVRRERRLRERAL